MAKDIQSMDMKINEVQVKLGQLKERDSGFRIDGVPIMKGSTLTFNIVDGQFDDQFFDPTNPRFLINLQPAAILQKVQLDNLLLLIRMLL